MKEIKLTQGKVALVDDEDYEYLNQWKWYAYKHKYKHTYYARKSKNNKCILMHRIIMNTPPNLQVDHVYHNGLDNRKFIEINGRLKQNLRNCTNSQNSMNKTALGKSKYLGVSYVGKYITAKIRINGRLRYLGSFKTEDAAALAYNEAAKIYHGEFANLNIIE